jgi:hypothetical protein
LAALLTLGAAKADQFFHWRQRLLQPILVALLNRFQAWIEPLENSGSSWAKVMRR